MEKQAICEQEMFAIALDSLASLPPPAAKTKDSNS